jgi:hypothetical protein
MHTGGQRFASVESALSGLHALFLGHKTSSSASVSDVQTQEALLLLVPSELVQAAFLSHLAAAVFSTSLMLHTFPLAHRVPLHVQDSALTSTPFVFVQSVAKTVSEQTSPTALPADGLQYWFWAQSSDGDTTLSVFAVARLKFLLAGHALYSMHSLFRAPSSMKTACAQFALFTQAALQPSCVITSFSVSSIF